MRMLLSGYYGFGNLGDDALLSVIVEQLCRRYEGATIDVLSAKPEETMKDFGVDATPRWDAKAVRAAIKKADIVLSGGGGLLQNATSLRSLFYYAGVIRTATRASRRAMVFAQSIGPLDFWGKAVVKECCKHLSAATVRDARSARLLRGLVPPNVPVEQTADPVFLYEGGEESVDLAAEGLGPHSDPLVVFSVRKANGLKERLELLAHAADRFAQIYGARVAFLPLGGVGDAEASTLVIRKCKTAPVLLPECSLPRAATIIRQAKAVVGMRLHAVILAARYAVPFLAIPYDPKVSALCEDLHYPLPPLFTLGNAARKPEFAQIDALLEQFWTQREALSQQLAGAGERLRALALRNFDVLDEVMNEKSPHG